MESDVHEEQALPREVAERIAAYLAQQDGVSSATVMGPERQLLASTGGETPESDAALTAFICERADAIPMEGDLRGMGKLVAESEFQQLAISGTNADGLLMRLRGATAVLITGRAGQLASAATAASVVASRYGRAAGGR